MQSPAAEKAAPVSVQAPTEAPKAPVAPQGTAPTQSAASQAQAPPKFERPAERLARLQGRVLRDDAALRNAQRQETAPPQRPPQRRPNDRPQRPEGSPRPRRRLCPAAIRAKRRTKPLWRPPAAPGRRSRSGGVRATGRPAAPGGNGTEKAEDHNRSGGTPSHRCTAQGQGQQLRSEQGELCSRV